jgi:aminoglycoside/choline kinase family phosphotransferase
VAGSNLTLHTLRPDLYLFMTELVERVLPDFDCAQMASDFDALIDFLADAETNFFMYRDFQARNIMIVDGAPYFIDFQGGCRGPLQYDVVSLLYQTSARIPQTERDNLLQSYLEAARQIHPLNVDVFTRFISAFVVYRMLQVLGVYGKQGLGAGKEYFSSSIPGALRTLIYELQRKDFPLSLAKLLACGERLLNAFTND